MSSLGNLDLCRLCLVKDRVSVPIFEGEGDVRQIFLKITACLPVKVNREDKLPKKICDDCVYKVELCYQFWHTTANAEKQLLQWLGEVNMEDKQGYNVLNPNGMKEQNNENRLDGTVMQQVSEHQNNMNMGMMDNMGLSMPIMMSSNAQQQITSVPMDNSGSSVQNVQPVAGPSTQTTHDQITQNQTDTPTQQEEEEESSEEEENSDDECDGDEGLPIKEESEEDPNNSRTIEPTTFVNVSLACDEAGPSGLQQQKIADMPEMVMSQTADVDPKTGILEVGELIGQGIKIERSEEKSEGYHTQTEIDSTVEDLVIKKEEEEPFNAAYSENFKNTLINAEKRKDRSERARYECSVCHVTFTRNGRYKQHMVKHSDERPYKCTACEKRFKRMSEMNNHMQIHTGVTYTCDLCGLISRNIVSLRVHVRRVHKRDFRHRCEQCGKEFISKYDFEDHKTRHLDAKTFVCDDCGNAYLQKSYLVSHKRVHGAQTFLCAQCGKKFATNHALKQHERVHTGERPYQCKSCLKAFKRVQALRVHKLIHTGDKPYECDICGQTFTQSSSMKKHRRRHPDISIHPPPSP